jgi:hypothetical protein
MLKIRKDAIQETTEKKIAQFEGEKQKKNSIFQELSPPNKGPVSSSDRASTPLPVPFLERPQAPFITQMSDNTANTREDQ